eukprot:TRINITY_DN11651_c0_g1_i1.p1 TRINITY_DN11651_c0_g1~~TRINITY_DN11651_c0_g1_i1.p1  ORF type:complete len:105 (+),score=7.12 TRINITY_DN11651_c0_g1_i1:207-521(+)
MGAAAVRVRHQAEHLARHNSRVSLGMPLRAELRRVIGVCQQLVGPLHGDLLTEQLNCTLDNTSELILGVAVDDIVSVFRSALPRRMSSQPPQRTDRYASSGCQI